MAARGGHQACRRRGNHSRGTRRTDAPARASGGAASGFAANPTVARVSWDQARHEGLHGGTQRAGWAVGAPRALGSRGAPRESGGAAVAARGRAGVSRDTAAVLQRPGRWRLVLRCDPRGGGASRTERCPVPRGCPRDGGDPPPERRIPVPLPLVAVSRRTRSNGERGSGATRYPRRHAATDCTDPLPHAPDGSAGETSVVWRTAAVAP